MWQFTYLISFRSTINNNNVSFAIDDSLKDRVYLGHGDDFHRVGMILRLFPGHDLPFMIRQQTQAPATMSLTHPMETPEPSPQGYGSTLDRVSGHADPVVAPAVG